MDYTDRGTKILELIGGKENVIRLTHCMTRLRFMLKDDSLADSLSLEALPYVLGVVKNENEFQVVIGPDVDNFYQAIEEMLDVGTKEVETSKKSFGAKFADIITGIFIPIIPALTAAGMLQALLALLVTLHVISSDTQTYQILSFMGNTVFYFLPILLANSAAKKFKCNPFLAMMLGAMLLHPDFVMMVTNSIQSGEAINFIGVPIYNATYSSSVIPIILGVWLMSKVELLAEKVSPKQVKFFMKPLLTFLVTGLLTLIVLGPIGYIVGVWISDGINFLDNIAGWIVPTLIGSTLPLLVMTGIHHGLNAIAINNIAAVGFDSMIFPGQLASNVAQGAAGFAVSLKAKNSQIKQMATATSFTAMCGITEPILYGVTLNVRTNLIATMIGGGVSGFFFGIFSVKNYLFAAPGLLTLTGYISEDGGLKNFYLAIAGTALGAIVSFVLAFILYKEKNDTMNKEENSENSRLKNDSLRSPVNGEAIPIHDVNDPTFSNELMGKGVAILPNEGKVYAPADGTIISVFPTKHAIAMVSNSGAEILIHVGIDTIKLKGKYFDTIIESGKLVKQGDLLLTFDKEAIEQLGYDSVIPMIITNSKDYTDISVSLGNKNSADTLLTLQT